MMSYLYDSDSDPIDSIDQLQCQFNQQRQRQRQIQQQPDMEEYVNIETDESSAQPPITRHPHRSTLRFSLNSAEPKKEKIYIPQRTSTTSNNMNQQNVNNQRTVQAARKATKVSLIHQSTQSTPHVRSDHPTLGATRTNETIRTHQPIPFNGTLDNRRKSNHRIPSVSSIQVKHQTSTTPLDRSIFTDSLQIPMSRPGIHSEETINDSSALVGSVIQKVSWSAKHLDDESRAKEEFRLLSQRTRQIEHETPDLMDILTMAYMKKTEVHPVTMTKTERLVFAREQACTQLSVVGLGLDGPYEIDSKHLNKYFEGIEPSIQESILPTPGNWEMMTPAGRIDELVEAMKEKLNLNDQIRLEGRDQMEKVNKEAERNHNMQQSESLEEERLLQEKRELVDWFTSHRYHGWCDEQEAKFAAETKERNQYVKEMKQTEKEIAEARMQTKNAKLEMERIRQQNREVGNDRHVSHRVSHTFESRSHKKAAVESELSDLRDQLKSIQDAIKREEQRNKQIQREQRKRERQKTSQSPEEIEENDSITISPPTSHSHSIPKHPTKRISAPSRPSNFSRSASSGTTTHTSRKRATSNPSRDDPNQLKKARIGQGDDPTPTDAARRTIPTESLVAAHHSSSKKEFIYANRVGQSKLLSSRDSGVLNPDVDLGLTTDEYDRYPYEQEQEQIELDHQQQQMMDENEFDGSHIQTREQSCEDENMNPPEQLLMAARHQLERQNDRSGHSVIRPYRPPPPGRMPPWVAKDRREKNAENRRKKAERKSRGHGVEEDEDEQKSTDELASIASHFNGKGQTSGQTMAHASEMLPLPNQGYDTESLWGKRR